MSSVYRGRVTNYLIEIDVHALKLKVRSAIVPTRVSNDQAEAMIDTYTPEPSRPCSPEICCLLYCQLGINTENSRCAHTRRQHQFGCPSELSVCIS